jgi:competence protein ComEC
MSLVSPELLTSAPAGRPRAPNYHPLVVVLVAACAGIVLDRYWPRPLRAWGAVALLGLLAWAALWWRGRQGMAAAALLLTVASIAGAWHHLRWYLIEANDLTAFANEEPRPAAVRARAISEPRRIPAPPYDPLRGAAPTVDNTQLEVRATAIRDGRDWRAAVGRATLTVNGHLLGVHAGDSLEVFADLSRITDPGNPGEPDFAAHRRADGVRCQLRTKFPECVTVLQRGSAWSVARWLEAARNYGDAMLWRHLNEDRSGFAAALLLGSREQLDSERTEAFFETGTVHILAISGAHVAILASSLFLALRWGLLPRSWALLAVAGAATVYVLLTGSPASAVRSLVIVLLFCLAAFTARPSLAFNCWAASGLIVLAINPSDLFRVGPQLSFLAVATLAWFGPHWTAWTQDDALQRLITQTRSWPIRAVRWLARWTWRATLITAAVWLVTLPLVMHAFHLASPVAVPLTTLLSLPITIALNSGFGVLVFGWLVPPFAGLLGWICDVCLRVSDWLVNKASQLPGGHFWVAGPDAWWVLGFYLGLGLWAALGPWRPRRPLSLGLLGAWIALGLAVSWVHRRPVDRLQCTFLSVGHGCCVVLELPEGKTVLYDAGRLGSPSGGTRSIAGFLWWRGITHIDSVIVSHADVDHYNALPSLLRQFSIDKVYVSPVMFRPEQDGRVSAAVRTLQDALKRSKVPVIEVWDQQTIAAEAGCLLRVLHPPREGVTGSDNANSIVLAVEHAGRRILLTGDLEKAGIERLLASPRCDCDVLLAPHHGSKNSNPPGFAAWSTPEWVVISGGHGVAEEMVSAYRTRDARVLHTARDGAVRVRMDAAALEVQHWRGGVYRHVESH